MIILTMKIWPKLNHSRPFSKCWLWKMTKNRNVFNSSSNFIDSQYFALWMYALNVISLYKLFTISHCSISIKKFKITANPSQSLWPQNCGYYVTDYKKLAKKVVTPPLKTIKPMWIEFLCFHLAEIGMIWTRDCSTTKSDTTLGWHSMQGQVGSSSSETTV